MTASSPSAVEGRTTLTEAIVLKRITDTAWQVCDSRQPPHGADYLLGFVETVRDGVELMQVGDRFIWTAFPTMRDALEHVAATATTTAEQRAAGHLAWIHLDGPGRPKP